MTCPLFSINPNDAASPALNCCAETVPHKMQSAEKTKMDRAIFIFILFNQADVSLLSEFLPVAQFRFGEINKHSCIQWLVFAGSVPAIRRVAGFKNFFTPAVIHVSGTRMHSLTVPLTGINPP